MSIFVVDVKSYGNILFTLRNTGIPIQIPMCSVVLYGNVHVNPRQGLRRIVPRCPCPSVAFSIAWEFIDYVHVPQFPRPKAIK